MGGFNTNTETNLYELPPKNKINKKIRDENLFLINILNKKKKNKNSTIKTNKEKSFIKSPKNASLQLETKYLYQNQNKSTNIYNSLEIKQFDCSYNNYNKSYISYKKSKIN